MAFLPMVALGVAGGLANALQRPSKPVPQGPPATPQAAETPTTRIRKYRTAAQLFRNDDLRLGAAGKLGGIV